MLRPHRSPVSVTVLALLEALFFTSVPAAVRAEEPTTTPATQPAEKGIFSGGRTLTPNSPAPADPNASKPPIVSPVDGVSGGSGNKPTDVQLGGGVGASEGDRTPNASVTTRPTNAAPSATEHPAK